MAFYTKYRPSDFDNLVGQKFIKETLKKAIAEEKTLGAYLFCGPRGTGKTSTARLFAKTVNCLNSKNGNPCLECEICKNFVEQSLVDIVEIDAASHTGVDNIREIIEKAQFSPTKTKYKIYIIDEVHMLSKGAFNALLKILEEPPEHVKFILATTETHKVPETIISRCQRFDFKRISKDDIKKRLNFIAKSENIEIDEKSLDYIVLSANGGMRNAISLFEQMIFDGEIKYENIEEKLGITKIENLELFLEKLLKKDNLVLDEFDKIILEGKNVKLFIKDLIFLAKNKAIKKVKNNENIFDLINILEILDDSYVKSKNSIDENTTFLVGILKIIGERGQLKVESSSGKGENIKETSSQYSSLKEKIVEEKNFSTTILENENELETFSEENKGLKNKIENGLTADDLNNIFDDEIIKQDSVKIENSLNFNLQILLSKLKENKAKGAVIFSLKGAKINLQGEKLKIITQTKMVKNTLTNTENQDIIRKSLEDIGFKNIILVIE